MTLSWVPPDLSEACAVQSNVTSCSTSTFMFLRLIASLFGYSKDSVANLYVNSYYKLEFPEYSDEFYKAFDYEGEYIQEVHENSIGDEYYDFIVVGAGSAGCVVANRLTEVAGWKVLLLEAGEEEPEVAEVPAFAPMLQRSSIDWAYLTQPSSQSCLARENRQCFWARGKVMGGSSTINYMIYVRGGAEDYDEWAAMGNPGWTYREVLPYFIKSENNRNLESVESGYHGRGGYQNVEFHRYQDANIFPIVDAFRELGLQENDPNGQRQLGISLTQATVRNGERLSTNGAFIRPIRYKRNNLVVQTHTRVTRILMVAKSKTAYGVEYYLKGQLRTAVARKEVIISAGAINSPQILMASGIGPSAHLKSLGIKVIQDLPVGLNLQDHTTIDGVMFALTNETATTLNDEKRIEEVYFFKETHSGPLSATGSIQVNAMIQTKYETSKNRPDIQFSFDGSSVQNFFTDPILTARTRTGPLSYYDGVMVRPILLNPKSRGYILLNHSDPILGSPLIFANTFSERIDLLRIVEGIKCSLKLLETASLQKIGVRLVSNPLPACSNLQFGTDEYWICVVQSYTATIFHPAGTCKMGPSEDATAVVDPKLRVHGISNLRVIDASIMPTLPRGNTNAPTIMIGERGSDFIKESWPCADNADIAENFLFHSQHGLYSVNNYEDLI